MKQMRGSRSWASALAVLLAVLLGGVLAPGGQAAWAATDLQWTWTKGASVTDQHGTYGAKGTPAPANTPGAREGGVSWTDASGKLWLFGGAGWDSDISTGYLNDLWRHDPATGNWTWVKGTDVVEQIGTYGTRETPAPANTPGGRLGSVSWKDVSGNFWLFGGLGRDILGNEEDLNDLWKYDPSTNNWTWMKGSSTGGQPGSYGVRETPAPTGTPGGRYGSVSWTDASGGLWLFGGYGWDSDVSTGYLNDLWKFDPSTNNWTWMKGTDTVEQLGTYGTILTPAPGNAPGGRSDAVTWVDASGALWLFGGVGRGSDGPASNLNDLWKYDPSTNNWTWMKGADTVDQKGNYGALETPAAANTPGARNTSVSWTDATGAFWLFGGFGWTGGISTGYLNDLWKYDPSTGFWTWMKGANSGDQLGTYGTILTPSPDNTPGGREQLVTWADASTGALWMFGGFGYDGTGNGGSLNDLWRITVPDIVAPTGALTINGNKSVTNNANVTLSLSWADKGGSGASRMKFSNDAVTWSAWEPLAGNKAWTLPAGDGYKTVRAMFRDKAGNNSVIYSDFIRLDTTPPTGSIIINAGAASTKNRVVSLGLTWSDGTGSGVTRMRFSIDGAKWTAWEPQKAVKSYTLPSAPGYYTVRVQYLDAGNNYSAIYNDYIKLVAL